jgi:predicted transcriptional regulator
MPPTVILLLRAFNISSISLQEALSVDEEILKPNCSSTKILLISMCFRHLSYIIFSKTLENEVNKEIDL